MFRSKKTKTTKESPRAKNKRLRRLIYIISIVFIVFFGGLLSYMVVSFSKFNIIRIRFADNPNITENVTIQYLFVGQPDYYPNGTISEAILFGGFINIDALYGNLGNFALLKKEFKILVPVEITVIQLAIIWVNETEFPSTIPMLLSGSDISITAKSQIMTITKINVISEIITVEQEETNFWFEILTI